MSSISKMQIRGIRSFSPDHDETIEFYSPLTMIVGANGCGKTTIIESLKFATTGSLPPNTKGGSSLVNDPGLSDATEVKAGIKLRFQNRSNRVCVAVRSLQVTRKRTKLEFKALEGVLRTTDEHNETFSISMKCSDMDRLIPENLGVSPAILENVIFVHQEDSNWPMQEGMVLKKRFDDVFESTRYTKALEALIKSKKEFSSKLKDLKAELAEYSGHLYAATNTRNELEKCEVSQQTCVKAIENLNEKISEVELKLRNANFRLVEVNTTSSEVEKLQIQVIQQEQFLKDRKKSLETELTKETDNELTGLLHNFENVMVTKQQQLITIKQKIDLSNQEILQLRDIMNDLTLKKGQALSIQDQIQSLQQNQITTIQLYHNKYPTTFPNITKANQWNANVTKECLAILQQEYQQLSRNKDNQLSDLRVVVDEKERIVNDINNKLSKIDIELKLKTEEIHSLTQESEMKRMEMNKLSSSRTQVQRCEMEYQSALRSHDEFMESYNAKTAEYKKQLKDVADQIRELQERISQDTQLLQDLSHHRSELAAFDANLKQVDSDLSVIQLELNSIFSVSNRDILQEISLTVPKTQSELELYAKQLENKQAAAHQQLGQSREQLAKLQSDYAASDALLTQQQSQLTKLQGIKLEYQQYEKEMKLYVNELNALRSSKILADSGFELISQVINIEELLIAAKVTEDEARELLVIAKSGRVFLKRLKKARQQNPNQCPCCGQTMGTPAIQQEFDQRTKQLFPFGDEESQGTVEEHKEILTNTTNIHEKIFILHQKMLPLFNQQQEVIKYETLAKEYQSKKDLSRREMNKQETIIQQNDTFLQQYNKILRSFQDIITRWKNLDNKKQDIIERKRRQSEQSLLFSSSNTFLSNYNLQEISIDEIEKLHHERMETKDTLQLKKEKITNDDNQYQRKYFTVKSMLQEKETALSAAKLENNRILELENAMKSIEQKLEEIDVRKRLLQQEKKTYNNEYNECNQQYYLCKQDYEKKEQEYQQQLNIITKEKETLTQYYTQYDELNQRYTEINYNKILQKINETQETISEQEKVIINDYEPILQQYQQELLSQERTKKNIINNIEYRKQFKDIDSLKALLKEKEAIYGSAELVNEKRQLEKQIHKINKERDEIMGECQNIKGQLQIFERQSKDLTDKLNSNIYRGIEEKHRKKLIELETTQLAVSDIDNYYLALDRALQDFHTLKIKEINKIIRELWQLIYQGQDIDTIEIQSGSDITDADGFAVPATSSASASSSRSYNYRVVMKKGDIPLEMRGRCSAGQKILAAIVIRLALAETFCLNCGILALDEPTTNLDEANKHGLAAALARLIVGRSKQQNFQLVCITHDEEFVQMIRTELSFSTDFNLPEYYFRVYRSEEGNSGRFFSHIERIPWEDM